MKPWIDVIDKYDVRLTLSGSQHNYERSCPVLSDDTCTADDGTGTTAFQVSTGGIGLREFTSSPDYIVKRFSDTHGWLRLTLRPDGGFAWKFVAVSGPGVRLGQQAGAGLGTSVPPATPLLFGTLADVPGTRPRDRPSPLEVLDGTAFVLAGAAATWLALLILREGLALDWRLLLVVAFWVIAAYLALPRVHRVLTYLYLPSYFIGRARTSDGLLGDPVNLALRGDEQQVHDVMERAGWVRADEVTLASSVRIVTTTLRRASYPDGPDARPQDFAYQQEVAGNPAQRHHGGWHCPGLDAARRGGRRLARGRHLRPHGGAVLFTFQVTHRIAQDIDVERDFIVSGVTGPRPRSPCTGW